jgi:hypothetical protein
MRSFRTQDWFTILVLAAGLLILGWLVYSLAIAPALTQKIDRIIAEAESPSRRMLVQAISRRAGTYSSTLILLGTREHTDMPLDKRLRLYPDEVILDTEDHITMNFAWADDQNLTVTMQPGGLGSNIRQRHQLFSGIKIHYAQ